MGLEIEKKFRLTREQGDSLRRRLSEVDAAHEGVEFEENTIYTGGALDSRRSVLRLRRVGNRNILTYKERFASDSAIKRQREDETRIENAEALGSILDALGYRPALVYEKRRTTWRFEGADVVIDELPFGLFVEIEGEENRIKEVEQLLELSRAEAEHESYPELTSRYGSPNGSVIEARFKV